MWYLYLFINCVNVCSIYFHYVHSLLLGVCLSFPEHNCIFWSFLAPPLAQHQKNEPIDLFKIITDAAGSRMGLPVETDQLKAPSS